MELKEFHVADGGSGSVSHGDSISGSNPGICCLRINLAGASSREEHRLSSYRLERAVGREHRDSCNSVAIEAKVGRKFEFGKCDPRSVLGTSDKGASNLTARRISVCMQ